MDRITVLAGNAVHALPALLAVVPVYLLGVAMAWCLGVRGRSLTLISAMPLLVGGAALVGETFALVGLPASPLRVLLGLVLVSAVVGGGRYLVARRRAPLEEEARGPAPLASPWVAIGGIGGVVLGLAVWLPGIADWRSPPQANDDIFHGYLVARLADATDLGAGAVAPAFVGSAAPVSYYPYGLHLVMAMARSVTSATVPAVMNGTWVLLLGVLLPLSTAVAAREVFKSQPRVALWAGLLAPTPTALYLLNGVMSYALTLALVPAVLALVLHRMSRPRDVPTVALGVALASLFISHPAVALTAAIAVSCVALGVVVRRGGQSRAALLRILPAALVALTLIVPWYRAAGSSGVAGSTAVAALMSPSAAVSAGLRLATPWAPGQLFLAALVVLGAAAVMLWRAGCGLLLAYVIFLAAYVSVLAGFAPIAGRTGVWYGQWYRLAGAVGVLAPLLAAAGAELVVRRLRRAGAPERTGAVRKVATAALVVAVTAGGLSSARYLLRNESVTATAWGFPTVTAQDRRFFDEVAQVVGKDEQVLNYWADGSTWMYALAGVTPAIPYDTTVQSSPWPGAVLNDVRALRLRPDLCKILLDERIRYALAKETLVAGAPNTFYSDLAGDPDLFREISRSSTTVLYAVNTSALQECEQSG